MPTKESSEYDKIVGKWILKIDDVTISVEFLEGGTFNCFSKNSTYQKLLLFSEELDQKFYLFKTSKVSPTWELKDGKIKILVSNEEKNFNYYFSYDNQTLTLTNVLTKESLSFQKDHSSSEIGSMVSYYLKFNFILVILYFFILFCLIYVFMLLHLDNFYLIVITLGLVVFVGIAMYFV